MDWEKRIDTATYGSACLSSDFLIVASHTTGPYASTQFTVFWLESGETYNPVSALTYTKSERHARVISMASAGEGGIYALAKYSDISEASNEYTVDLIEFRIGTSKELTLQLLASRSLPGEYLTKDVADGFKKYPPTHIFLYYPLGNVGHDIPGVFLAGHLDPKERTGLLLYGFSRTEDDIVVPYSYNPFAVPNDGSCAYRVLGTTKCLKCATTSTKYVLSSPFTCETGCKSNYFLQPDTNKCTVCHLTCFECSGPSSSQCTDCGSNSAFNSALAQCLCTGDWCFSRGSCNTICQSSSSYRFKSIRDSSPTFAFDLAKKFNDVFVNPSTVNGDSSYYRLSKCVRFPVAGTKMPEEFFLGLWVYQDNFTDGSVILSGLSGIEFSVMNPPGIEKIKMTVVDGYSSISVQLGTKWNYPGWRYLALSIKNEALSYMLTGYVHTALVNGVAESDDFTTKGYTAISYSTYDPNIYVGCTISKYATANPDLYVRDLVYIPKYFDSEDMPLLKSLVFSSALKIYGNIIAYWRCNKIEGGHFVDEITGTPSSESGTMSWTEESNTKLREVRMVESVLGIVGASFDMFFYAEFPRFSFNTQNFPSELKTKINVNSFAALSGIVHNGDYISFHLGTCGGEKIGEVKVEFNSVSKVSLTGGQPFPTIIGGRYISSCYCNADYSPPSNCILLGKTYFPLLPHRVSPGHGVTELGASSHLLFEMAGGDQSYTDKLCIVRVDSDVGKVMEEVIEVNEKTLSGEYAVKKQSSGVYEKLATLKLESGVYTLAWRPSYLSCLTDDTNCVYKNLFITWTIQEPPKVNFPLISGTSNSYKSYITHRKEFLYLDLQGSGQADGDQVVFCQTSCVYLKPYVMSRVFQRENDRYSPIWFAQLGDVASQISKTDVATQRLFVCWRPAARANRIAPEEDQWTALEDVKSPGEKAYVSILEVDENYPEMMEISLNKNWGKEEYKVLPPVLSAGEILWLVLKQRGAPIESNGNEIIKIYHVVYNTAYKTSFDLEKYNYEPLWSGKLPPLSSSAGENIIGADGNFTLQDLPYDKMIYGHDYMLLMYGGAFHSNEPSGPFGELRFLFRYREVVVNEPNFVNMAPLSRDVSVGGENFGSDAIAGRQFEEVRKLFGVVVNVNADPPCDSEIKAGFIQRTLDESPTQLCLKDLDLTSCKSQHTLTVDFKFIKLTANFLASLQWSATNSSKSFVVGLVGCDSSCKACDGPSSLDCVSCNSALPYLYRGQCLAKCPSSMRYFYMVFQPGSYIIDYYRCSDECTIGYYLEAGYDLCMPCNYQCATCVSEKTHSCTSCKGTFVEGEEDYMNKYSDAYAYKGMCLYECPKVWRDENTNVMLSDEFLHKCEADEDKLQPVYFNVTIQPLFFDTRIDVARSLYLRALFEDLRDFDGSTEALEPSFLWVAHPEEDTTVKGFLESDKRIFINYTDENMRNIITELNVNAFNFKSDRDNTRVVVNAWASGGFDFDIIEIYGNKPPELDINKITFKFDNEVQTSETATMKTMEVGVRDIPDADDYYQIMKFKVILVPRSLVLENLPKDLTTPISALELLAQLPGDHMILYTSKIVTEEDEVVTLKDIYIPPLINGSQVISKTDNVVSDAVSCDLLVYIEDRHSGLAKAKFIYKIKETYSPENKMQILQELYNHMLTRNNDNSLTWDDALRIAHTLRVVAPLPRSHYTAYAGCARDDECSNGGKCVTSGGWSECVCDLAYTGATCDWAPDELRVEKDLVRMALQFLNISVLVHVDKLEEVVIDDIDIVDQVANILIGVLKNPEMVPEEFFSCITDLAHYMTRIDYTVAGRMELFERKNVYKATDFVVKYVHFHLRKNIYQYYAFSENYESFSKLQRVQHFEMRENLFNTVKVLRDSLYRFVDASSVSHFTSDVPFYLEYDTFEIFLASVVEDSIFEALGDSLGIQFKSGGYFKLPTAVLKNIRKEVSVNEEFKVRVVKWKENPFIFSEYHSEVCTPVFGFALLNANSTPIALTTSSPIVFFIPITSLTKNFPENPVRCMHFNEKHRAVVMVRRYRKVNVNGLELTDEEKMSLFAEWNADYYHTKNLIVDIEEYFDEETDYPEFEDIDGISSYGNILDPGDYSETIMCALYSKGEVAGVAQRKTSHRRGFQPISSYHTFDPMESKEFNICIRTCIAVGCLFIVTMLVAFILDAVLLPKHTDMMIERREANAEGKPLIEMGKEKKVLLTKQAANSEFSNDYNEERKLNAMEVNKTLNNLDEEDKDMRVRRIETYLEKKATKNNEDKSQVFRDDSYLRKKSILRKPQATNATTTHHITADPFLLTGTEDQKGCVEIVPKPLRKPSVADIFSIEHIKSQEKAQFGFWHIFIYSNLFLNMLLRTNTMLVRAERCFTMFAYVYLMMMCSAVLMSGNETLDHPEYYRSVRGVSRKNVWVVFVSPILCSLIFYLVAGLFKTDEERIRKTKTPSQYRRVS